jgi:excisionase family DNA binding protein
MAPRNAEQPSYERRLLSVSEVAARLGLRRQTIYNKMSQGLFPIRHLKLGRLVRFDCVEVENYLDGLRSHR